MYSFVEAKLKNYLIISIKNVKSTVFILRKNSYSIQVQFTNNQILNN